MNLFKKLKLVVGIVFCVSLAQGSLFGDARYIARVDITEVRTGHFRDSAGGYIFVRYANIDPEGAAPAGNCTTLAMIRHDSLGINTIQDEFILDKMYQTAVAARLSGERVFLRLTDKSAAGACQVDAIALWE